VLGVDAILHSTGAFLVWTPLRFASHLIGLTRQSALLRWQALSFSARGVGESLYLRHYYLDRLDRHCSLLILRLLMVVSFLYPEKRSPERVQIMTRRPVSLAAPRCLHVSLFELFRRHLANEGAPGELFPMLYQGFV